MHLTLAFLSFNLNRKRTLMNICTSYSHERQISATTVGNVIRAGELNQKMEWTWLLVAKESSKGKKINKNKERD